MLTVLGTSRVQAQWHDVKANIDDSYSQGAYYNDITFLNTDFGWAVGDASTILQFDGMGWRKQETPKNAAATFYSVSFSADTFGWIVGEGATFYQYNKEKNNWQFFKNVEIDQKDKDKKDKPMIDVRSVVTLGKNNAWAVATGDHIFHFDGKRWTQTQCAGVTEQLYQMAAAGNKLWAVGENGIIIHYNGTAWSKQQSSTTQKLRSVFFVNEELGYAAGDNNTLLMYDKGVWKPMNTSFTEQNIRIRSIYMLDQSKGWAVGDKGMILKYENGVWTCCKEKVAGNIFTRICFTNEYTGWICGQASFISYEGQEPENTQGQLNEMQSSFSKQ